jgi:hypothetical protein
VTLFLVFKYLLKQANTVPLMYSSDLTGGSKEKVLPVRFMVAWGQNSKACVCPRTYHQQRAAPQIGGHLDWGGKKAHRCVVWIFNSSSQPWPAKEVLFPKDAGKQMRILPDSCQ